MLAALVQKLTTVAVAVAMLAAGMRLPCRGECPVRPLVDVAPGNSHACCAASRGGAKTAEHASKPHCPKSDSPKPDSSHFPCQHCCTVAAATPAVPASSVQVDDVGAKTVTSHHANVDTVILVRGAIAGPPGIFWRSATDGPSRQAMLCRFTT
jgi:hypothetical protein